MNHCTKALAICLLGLGACKNAAEPPAASVRADVDRPSPVCEAHASLEEMDTRVAVPLLPAMANHQKQNMRDHLLAVQEIVLAAGRDDFVGVETAAGRIGFSPQMGQMCTHMGAGAKGFTEQALAFHHSADSIGTAARQHDRAAVMTALGSTLQSCTGCHETFRQRVVDQATWTRLTAAAPPAAHHPGG
jgi:Cytochrome C'